MKFILIADCVLSTERVRIRQINKKAKEDLEVWVMFLEDVSPTKLFSLIVNKAPDYG